MSSDSISSIRGTNYSGGSSSKAPLTDETKSKLEALGVDTSKITTEAQGQAVLKASEKKQEDSKKATNPLKSNSEQSLKASAKSLADEMIIPTLEEDTTDDILERISKEINKLEQEAGNDEVKRADIENYKIKLENISIKYSDIKTSKQKLDNSMNGLASYNKIYQKLS